MPEMTTYQGGCHCGAVRFAAESPPIEAAMSCNCSFCIRQGALLAFVPASAFNLLSGDAALSDYQFGSKTIHHLFCGTCGVGSFGRGTMPDGSEAVALNVRCLDGIDLDALTVQNFDGKSI